MSLTSRPGLLRRLLAAIAGRGSDIISMNRALASAVQRHQQTGDLAPGDLDRALRAGRVRLIVHPSRPNGPMTPARKAPPCKQQ